MIRTLEELHQHYPQPKERTLLKQLDRLEEHSMRFVRLSPFLVLSSRGIDGTLDASPRGGEPGFVKIADEKTLLIPDAPGNNRLDSLTNIVQTGNVGLLFLIPGVDETLRLNGVARLRQEQGYLQRFADAKRVPKVVIEVEVQELYIHCAKAFMRSQLWNPELHVDRETLPTIGKMINDQIGSTGPAETREEMVKRYTPDL